MFIGSILNQGCKTIDPAVDIPSYISVASFDLKTNYLTEGTDEHNITDVWVLVDDVSIGAYELPATIPILAEGYHEIRLFGGIKANGISSTRFIYPFFGDTAMIVKLIPGSTINLSPTISYFSDITFDWLEDFADGNTLSKLSGSDTAIVLASVSTLPAMGTQSAVIHVDAVNEYFIAGTQGKQFILPLGRPIYLELQYASNITLSVGAIKYTNTGSEMLIPYINLFPSGEWNKIYINLTEYVKPHTDALYFEIYFACQYDAAVAENTIFLDNIKLLYK
ncbi:MAG: hypothetical protein JKY18_04320 [Flavobacteriales bacterium]|nr:hypothetical protein [Flavobacteriales bacterium]